LDELLYLDLDSTIIESHGLAKRGAALGYSKVRGHHPLIARAEDAHRARTGDAPAVLAAVRNLVTTALRLIGTVNIAADPSVLSANCHRLDPGHTRLSQDHRRKSLTTRDTRPHDRNIRLTTLGALAIFPTST